jgi:hypothetical protein
MAVAHWLARFQASLDAAEAKYAVAPKYMDTADHQYDTWLNDHNIGHSLSNLMLFGLVQATRHVIDNVALNAVGVFPRNGGTSVIFAPVLANLAHYDADVTHAQHLIFSGHGNDLARDAVILCVAAQAGDISDENTESYFQSRGIEIQGARIADWANTNNGRFGNMLAQGPIVALAANNIWLKYRLTVASGIGLVDRALATIPNLFTAPERTAVANYLAAPWDMALAQAVPTRAIAKAYALGEVYDFLPNKWYMGEKAINSTPAQAMANWRAFAKAYKRKSTEIIVHNADAAVDMAGLAAIALALA